MALERLVHGIGNFARTSIVHGLVGLAALGSGYLPASAQQEARYSSAGKVEYVPCTQEQAQYLQKMQKESGKKSENLGMLLGLSSLLFGLQGNPDALKIGAVASLAGRMQHQKEVAREGRDNITINQGQQMIEYSLFPSCAWVNPDPNSGDLRVRRSIGMAITANYFKDFNRNGNIELDEFVGINDTFRDDEDLIISLYNPWYKSPPRLSLEVYSPKGEKIYDDSMEASVLGATLGLNPDLTKSDLMGWLINKGGHGEYIAVWSAGGIAEMVKFKILESPEKKQKKETQEEIKD